MNHIFETCDLFLIDGFRSTRNLPLTWSQNRRSCGGWWAQMSRSWSWMSTALWHPRSWWLVWFHHSAKHVCNIAFHVILGFGISEPSLLFALGFDCVFWNVTWFGKISSVASTMFTSQHERCYPTPQPIPIPSPTPWQRGRPLVQPQLRVQVKANSNVVAPHVYVRYIIYTIMYINIYYMYVCMCIYIYIYVYIYIYTHRNPTKSLDNIHIGGGLPKARFPRACIGKIL